MKPLVISVVFGLFSATVLVLTVLLAFHAILGDLELARMKDSEDPIAPAEKAATSLSQEHLSASIACPHGCVLHISRRSPDLLCKLGNARLTSGYQRREDVLARPLDRQHFLAQQIAQIRRQVRGNWHRILPRRRRSEYQRDHYCEHRGSGLA
ncbi:hypothetical protein [uncultured Marivita sp.]|uniref:hypothetical protein n=1 Tax=uncultured Marivita sp. TaxID=888080 RepID=UPI00260B0618|nr:hypothetical protein [uncultured Marivita sp.]